MSARTRRTEIEIDLAADSIIRAAIQELTRGDDSRRLEAANRLRHAADAVVTEYVATSREQGATCSDIGETLGVSTQAAHQKYRYVSVDADGEPGVDLTEDHPGA